MMPAPRQGRPLAAALAAVFAVGAAVGAYGWSVRDRIAESSDIELAAGAVTVEVPSVGTLAASNYRVVASVFNADDSDVTVVEARPPGWTVTGSQPSITLPAREWASIPLTVAPDCHDVPPTPELELRLGAESGGQLVTLPLRPHTSDAFALHSVLCSENEAAVHLLLDDIETVSDDDALNMTIPVRMTAGRTEPVTLSGLDATTPALRATAAGLPMRLAPGETATVTVHWTVEDCAAVDQLGEVLLRTRTERPGTIDFPLPGRAVAALARLGVDSCSSY